MEDLLRTLYGSPRYVMPPLGPVPDLPPELPAEPQFEVEPDVGWRGLRVPVQPVDTALDTVPDRLGGPVLELQLHPPVPVPNLPMAGLRELVSDLERILSAALPSLRPLGSRSQDEWQVSKAVEGDVASVRSEPLLRSAGLGVSPDFPLYIDVHRNRTVVIAMRLRRDAISAKVDDASLQRIAEELISTASGLKVLADDVVPLLRLGPLDSVSPGDPGTLQDGSSSATFPWMHGGKAKTTGTDSIPLGYLRAHVAEVTTELVAQLVADLPGYGRP
ncbi:hypothetical protein DMA12_48080 [Amycolatopsis balhimycina DSM 5908]|uniref:Uncharacterized protein n=1 Tax=Amycolatopsis balhimycina DSM 5908 TaxID=1081091 RepID=A0A428VUJ5_AMYBA|nr:hypothetical protein DMA12_48080 [Amycolatopsis balhimycina DSM 5908]